MSAVVTGRDFQSRVAVTLQQLAQACSERNYSVSADGRVSEKDAAKLLCYAPGSLKNLRALGGSPKYYRRGVNGGQVSYRLTDLAEWLEAGREDW